MACVWPCPPGPVSPLSWCQTCGSLTGRACWTPADRPRRSAASWIASWGEWAAAAAVVVNVVVVEFAVVVVVVGADVGDGVGAVLELELRLEVASCCKCYQ